jgi:DNA-binding transcriptional regulator LsrR (DeoR family)
MENQRLELLARIAGLYYEDGLTQSQIAEQTGYSRSAISRLLAEAREQGVVEIRVHHPLERRQDLEQALLERLPLKTVRVLKRGLLNHAQMLRRLGALAAPLVDELIGDHATVGISWGTGLAELVNALRARPLTGIHVVQIIGLIGTSELPEIDNPELTQRLARTLGGRYSILPAPLLVDSETTREALRHDYRVERVLSQARHMDVALLGIGAVEPQYSTLVRAGYLSLEQAAELARAGAVGDVSAIYFDRFGRIVDVPLTRRIITIDPAALAAIPNKVGIAGGQAKPLPILGAVRAGLVNVLITDDVAAGGVLREMESEGRPV